MKIREVLYASYFLISYCQAYLWVGFLLVFWLVSWLELFNHTMYNDKVSKEASPKMKKNNENLIF